MEVFFDFFSFYYSLGTVSCQNNSFSTKFYVFLKIAMYQKIAQFSTLSTGVKLNHKWKFFQRNLFLLPFMNSTMPNNNVSKNSIPTKFYVFFWRLQCTKKLRNSPLCEPEWTSMTNGSFLRFFLFLLQFRNSTMPNNNFSKNSIIWVFQRNFMFFLKIAMYQKIAKFSTLWTGVNLNHKWKFSSIFLFCITV